MIPGVEVSPRHRATFHRHALREESLGYSPYRRPLFANLIVTPYEAAIRNFGTIHEEADAHAMPYSVISKLCVLISRNYGNQSMLGIPLVSSIKVRITLNRC